jgi:hypothetical protein
MGEFGEMGGEGASSEWMVEVGGDFAQRREDEAAVVHMRMRQLQIGAVDNPFAMEQQIEVEGARPPADMALAPMLVFDFVQGRQ